MCIFKLALPATKNIEELQVEAAYSETVLSKGAFTIACCLSVSTCGTAVDVRAIDCT